MKNRCPETQNLSVYHNSKTGDNSLTNARALCPKCANHALKFMSDGTYPPPFSSETIRTVLQRANNQCECININCHVESVFESYS